MTKKKTPTVVADQPVIMPDAAAEHPTVEISEADFIRPFAEVELPSPIVQLSQPVARQPVKYKANVKFTAMLGPITRSYMGGQLIDPAHVDELLQSGCDISPVEVYDPYLHCPNCGHAFKLE